MDLAADARGVAGALPLGCRAGVGCQRCAASMDGKATVTVAVPAGPLSAMVPPTECTRSARAGGNWSRGRVSGYRMLIVVSVSVVSICNDWAPLVAAQLATW